MFSQTVKKNMKILGLSVENSCLWKKTKSVSLTSQDQKLTVLRKFWKKSN